MTLGLAVGEVNMDSAAAVSSTRRTFLTVAIATSIGAAFGCADRGSSSSNGIALPSRPLALGTWVYTIERVTDGSFVSPYGTRTLEIQATDRSRDVRSIVVEDRLRVGGTPLDTLLVSTADLSPILYSARRSQRRRERFEFDRAAGEMGEPTVGPEPDDGIVIAGMVHLAAVIQTYALHNAWHKRFAAFGTTFTQYDVDVVREQTISVPAGTFVCWVVRVTKRDRKGWGPFYHTWWISKDTGWLIKSDSYDLWGNRDPDNRIEMQLSNARVNRE